MARLSELVSAASRALRFEERSAGLCARYLREAGLIAQKGRGPSAAHMGPTDATNLLFAIMASDAIKDAPANTRLVREATLYEAEFNFGGEARQTIPPYPFLKDKQGPLRLGEAVDALIDHVVRYGDPLNDEEVPMTNFLLKIERPGGFATMELDDEDRCWTTRYSREDPRLDGLEGETRFEEARKIYRNTQGGMKTTTQIRLDVIWHIAGVLRGYQPKEGEVVSPPYQKDARRRQHTPFDRWRGRPPSDRSLGAAFCLSEHVHWQL